MYVCIFVMVLQLQDTSFIYDELISVVGSSIKYCQIQFC